MCKRLGMHYANHVCFGRDSWLLFKDKESRHSTKAKIADKSSNTPGDRKNQMDPHYLRILGMPKQHKHLITFMKGGFLKKAVRRKEAVDHYLI